MFHIYYFISCLILKSILKSEFFQKKILLSVFEQDLLSCLINFISK
jgi:hypothetical protein